MALGSTVTVGTAVLTLVAGLIAAAFMRRSNVARLAWAIYRAVVNEIGAASAIAVEVKVGDSIPNVDLDKDFPPTKVNLPEFCKGKKVVLVGLPGAFTPT
mmetsp:Transcript_65872/g.153065  ORF Transcript_65872/g.153065 Transcript_65872/m.153065 type:complete len:100 (+) Transcript_65872:60-359(+)